MLVTNQKITFTWESWPHSEPQWQMPLVMSLLTGQWFTLKLPTDLDDTTPGPMREVCTFLVFNLNDWMF